MSTAVMYRIYCISQDIQY